MRISVEFEIRKLPVSYNMLFVSLIKEMLRKSNPEYYKKIYEYNGKRNKQTKNFTFSVKLHDFELKDDFFYVKNKLFFNISSPDMEFMINFYNGIIKTREFGSLKKIKIIKHVDKKIHSNEILIRSLSPLCIKDKKGTFLNLQDEGFNRELNYITNVCLMNFRGFGLKQDLELIPIGNKAKKTVVKEQIKGFQDITNKDYIFINAWEGMFLLKGDIEDLQVLQNLGLGFRRNQGFGMIEVIG